MRGIAIGLPGVILYPFLSSACQLDNDAERARRSSLSYFVADVVLDYAVVKLGFGLFGIGLATSLGYYLKIGLSGFV